MSNKEEMSPGWNDPPIIAYNECRGRARKNMLSMRVGYPINLGKIECQSAWIDPTAPPSGRHTGPPPMISTSPPVQKDLPKTVELSDEDFLNVPSKLNHLYNVCLPHLKEKQEDVKKRLDLFSSSWTSKSLSADVCSRMAELVSALSENNFEGADKLQRALMVDYVTQVNPWMSAIRQLIYTAKENMSDEIASKNEKLPPSPDQSDQEDSMHIDHVEVSETQSKVIPEECLEDDKIENKSES